VPRVTGDRIPELIIEIDRRLEVEREQFTFAARSSLKSEGFDISRIPPVLEVGSELDSILRGYQLAAVVGFVSALYLEGSLPVFFESALTDRIDNGRLQIITQFRDAYVQCDGDSERASRSLAEEVYRVWGGPEPRDRILKGLAAGAAAFMIMSHARTAGVFGDAKMERKLARIITAA